MFTNEQIRSAMEGLVKEKGEGHTSFGRYRDPNTGKGACFLGALCEHMGFAIPAEGTTARNVLGVGVLSKEMETAFMFAQFLNDRKFEWKYVLAGVDIILDRKITTLMSGSCGCGCDATADFRALFDEVTRLRALDRMKMPKCPWTDSGYATGGVITAATVKGIGVSTNGMGSITFNITAASGQFAALEKAFATLNASAQKKDHALVA